MRETKAIIVEPRFGIEILRRKAMVEEIGEGAGLGNDTAEVVVLVGGGDVAGFIYIFCDIAVVIVCRKVELAVAGHGKQTAHATCALK